MESGTAWVPVVSAVAAGMIGISGAFLGAWWTAKQDRERDERQRAWAREDRNFQDAKHVYLAYYEFAEGAANRLRRAFESGGGVEPDWLRPANGMHDRIWLYAEVDLSEAASRVQSALGHYAHVIQGDSGAYGPLTSTGRIEAEVEASNRLSDRLYELLEEIRRELGIPPRDYEGHRARWKPSDPRLRFIDDLEPGELERLAREHDEKWAKWRGASRPDSDDEGPRPAAH